MFMSFVFCHDIHHIFVVFFRVYFSFLSNRWENVRNEMHRNDISFGPCSECAQHKGTPMNLNAQQVFHINHRCASAVSTFESSFFFIHVDSPPRIFTIVVHAAHTKLLNFGIATFGFIESCPIIINAWIRFNANFMPPPIKLRG